MVQLPTDRFFLFGMGGRQKYVYQKGKLFMLPQWQEAASFPVLKEEFFPDRYRVELTLTDQSKVLLAEDEEEFYMELNGHRTPLARGSLVLPDFEPSPYASALRILLHEVLFNIMDGKPLPNLFVYSKPWYRDGAMMAMVLQETGNLDVIRDWVLSLTECFDRNNAGNREPDNIGQALYLISLVSDAGHPLVKELVACAHDIYIDGILQGEIDHGYHPVYAAKWLKYGLAALHLHNDWVEIPDVEDNYSTLFWMDYRNTHHPAPRREYDENYPYLWWAEQHFYKEPIEPRYLQVTYPMTNETNASEARYEGIRRLSAEYAERRNASPHTWHAAEMFLYLIDSLKTGW